MARMQIDALILSACRTPIGSFGGQFKDVRAASWARRRFARRCTARTSPPATSAT